ncbi:MAG: phosphotransferase [Dehalococcoidia bacterium]
MNEQIPAAALAPLLTAAYALPEPLQCTVIRRGFNDAYRVTTAAGEYVARVYLNGKYFIRADADFGAELALLERLAEAGLPVAAPVRAAAGDLLTALAYGEETRRAALFPFVTGEPAHGDLSAADATALGALVGRLHDAMDRFDRADSRYTLDQRYLLDQPLLLLRDHAGVHALADLTERARGYRALLARLARTAPAFGLIHADLNSGNILRTPDGGFTLIDFDHCAYGWRAYDLAPFWKRGGETWSAFLAGYESVRPLSAAEREAMPAFAAMRDLWDVGDLLAMMPAWGKAPSDQFLDEALATSGALSRDARRRATGHRPRRCAWPVRPGGFDHMTFRQVWAPGGSDPPESGGD